MKGMAFTELLSFVEQIHGADVVDDLIDACDLPSGGAYTAVGTYDHTEMQALVAALSRQSNTPPNELLEVFEQHLIGRFRVSFPAFFKAAPTLFDFLESIDRHIHVEARMLYPDAELPEFRAERHYNETMHLDYCSCRPFEALAAGLIRGAAQTYGEPIRLERSYQRGRRRQFRSLFDRANDAGALMISEAERHIGRITRLKRRVDRERRARREAETLLEAKSLELYSANCHLTALARDLETRVLDRTRELGVSRQKAQFLAERNPLTALANRLSFARDLDQAINSASDEKRSVHLLPIDLDRFKEVNDNYGHAVGNAVLCEVAERLRAACGEEETISRLGGDEFAVLCRSLFHQERGREVAAVITEAMGRPINYHQQQLPLTCSIGIARFPQDATDSTDLQRFADVALYRSKAAGRSMWTAFDERWQPNSGAATASRRICGAQSPMVASNPGISRSFRARLAQLSGSRPWRDGNIPSEGRCFPGFYSDCRGKLADHRSWSSAPIARDKK